MCKGLSTDAVSPCSALPLFGLDVVEEPEESELTDAERAAVQASEDAAKDDGTGDKQGETEELSLDDVPRPPAGSITGAGGSCVVINVCL